MSVAMESKEVADADLPSTDGGGPPERVNKLDGLESQGFTHRSGNVLKGAPPPHSQFSVPQSIDFTQPGPCQVTETPTGLVAVARGADRRKQTQTIADVTVASSGHTDRARVAVLLVASLPGVVKQPDAPASVASIVVAGSLATPVGVSPVLTVWESRLVVEPERVVICR